MKGFDVDTFNDPVDVLAHDSREICELLLRDIRMPILTANKA
jgi:FixJ family two-component response regulator